MPHSERLLSPGQQAESFRRGCSLPTEIQAKLALNELYDPRARHRMVINNQHRRGALFLTRLLTRTSAPFPETAHSDTFSDNRGELPLAFREITSSHLHSPMPHLLVGGLLVPRAHGLDFYKSTRSGEQGKAPPLGGSFDSILQTIGEPVSSVASAESCIRFK